MAATACVSLSRIRVLELIHLTTRKFSNRSLRQKSTVWGWAFPFVIQSSRVTMVGFGCRRGQTGGRSSNSNCRSTCRKVLLVNLPLTSFNPVREVELESNAYALRVGRK